MAIKVPDSGAEFKAVPSGSHAGRVDQIIDLGVQPGGTFKGVEIAPSRQVFIRFEFPDLLLENGKPMVLGKRLKLSLHEKSGLRKLAEGLIGHKLTEADLVSLKNDLSKLVGKTALVNVLHTAKGGNTFANVADVIPLPKGMKIGAAVNEPLVFSVDEPNEEAFNRLSDKMKALINRDSSTVSKLETNQSEDFE